MPVNCTNSCLNKVGHNFSCQSKVWKEFYRSFKKKFPLGKKKEVQPVLLLTFGVILKM